MIPGLKSLTHSVCALVKWNKSLIQYICCLVVHNEMSFGCTILTVKSFYHDIWLWIFISQSHWGLIVYKLLQWDRNIFERNYSSLFDLNILISYAPVAHLGVRTFKDLKNVLRFCFVWYMILYDSSTFSLWSWFSFQVLFWRNLLTKSLGFCLNQWF